MPEENIDQNEVQQAKLPDVETSAPTSQSGQIDVLLDTTMPVEVRLGEVSMPVRDLLQLSPGSVITLDKMVGEPLDLYLKGVKFATGQLVVAGDALGVRITAILPRRKSDRAPMTEDSSDQQATDQEPAEDQTAQND